MSEISLPLGGLARQNMTVISLFPFDLPALENLESFGRSAVALEFRHCRTPFLATPGWPGRSQQY